MACKGNDISTIDTKSQCSKKTSVIESILVRIDIRFDYIRLENSLWYSIETQRTNIPKCYVLCMTKKRSFTDNL